MLCELPEKELFCYNEPMKAMCGFDEDNTFITPKERDITLRERKGEFPYG